MEASPARTLTVAQAAQELGCSLDALYDAIRRDEAPFAVIRIGRRVLIPKAAIERLLSADDGDQDA